MGPKRIPVFVAIAAFTAAAATMPTLADEAEQAALDCLQGNLAAFDVIDPSKITQPEANQIVTALDDVMASARAVSDARPAADWTMGETIVSMFGQQAEWLRTGAVEGQLLRASTGVAYRWQDAVEGITLCLMPIPADASIDAPSGDPVIDDTALFWRAEPSDGAKAHLAQIVMISEIPGQ